MIFGKPKGDEPFTILFATIPFEYLADTAESWASRGVKGFMLARIMRNWDSDVWQVDGGRVVGESNPLFQRVKAMNRRCREHGVDRNFVKVAFYTHLPDWFDDSGWDVLVDNFRQAAAFSRGALFRGIAIDIEYISEMYELTWPRYQEPDYPLSQLRQRARERGTEIVRGMLDEYPEMEVLHLPHSVECYGPLAGDLFAGMCEGMAERDAPGGLHILSEATYQNTDVEWLVRYGQDLQEMVEEVLPETIRPYWRKRCSISYGLWPLGYYRDILDEEGNFLGYGGKKEKFRDEVVGSRADKSENYTASDFRRQFAVARMVCRKYIWIYCHGSTFWQLNEEEQARYSGSNSDALPVVENLDEYLGVLERGEILLDPEIAANAGKVRAGVRVDFLASLGSPRKWNLVGPFDNTDNKGFSTPYPPEVRGEVGDCYEGVGGTVCWQCVDVSSRGLVDLQRRFRPPDYRLAYAVCHADVPDDVEAAILLGSDDGVKLWVDDRLVYQLDTIRGAVPDEDRVPIRLSAGRHRFLLKVTNHRGSWGFYFRVVDTAGNPIEGLKFTPG